MSRHKRNFLSRAILAGRNALRPKAPAEAIKRKILSTDQARRQWEAEEVDLRQALSAASGSMPGAEIRQWLSHRSTNPALRHMVMPNEMPGRAISARYDSALTTDDNRLHWAMADGHAADAGMNPMIRYVLRNRSRYEVANNCYARGVGQTIANDFVGRGPRLHIDDSRLAPDVRLYIEREWRQWSQSIRLPEKLRTCRLARRQDGETFALIITNPGLRHPVKLDIRPIEADQVRFVDITLLTVPSVDGIRFDDYGNPVSYHVLRVHPGYWAYATGYIGMPWEYDVWDAQYVVHWFRPDRPGQHRGLPEMLAALPLYATLRRYTQATLDAAETAADFAVFLHTEAGADDVDERGEYVNAGLKPLSTFQLERRMAMALPVGYKPEQMRPEHPQQTYGDFKKQIISEIGRCENVPYNVAACDSSDSNFASGRLDHSIYFRQIDIERAECGAHILDRLLRLWVEEAVLIRNGGQFAGRYMPQELKTLGTDLEHSWLWDGHEMGNPVQNAQAHEILLSIGAEGLPEICGRDGKDWLSHLGKTAEGWGLTDDADSTAVQKLQAMLRTRVFTVRGNPPLIEEDLEEKELGFKPSLQPILAPDVAKGPKDGQAPARQGASA